MNITTKQKLLEKGVHFGHKSNIWNPKMKSYIATTKNKTHIINIDKTINNLNKAYKAIYEISKKDGKFMFVGTKKHSKLTIKENAIRSGSFYVDYRWLGGTLTNFHTIRKSIEKYRDLERMSKEGFDGYNKKEAGLLYKELKKLERQLIGIKYMINKPSAIFLTSSLDEDIALAEAKKLNIPIFAIVDTNADPDIVDFIIPANDDGNKSVSLITTLIADAICDAKGLEVKAAFKEDDKVEVIGEVVYDHKETVQRFKRQYSSNHNERDYQKKSYKKYDEKPNFKKFDNKSSKPNYKHGSEKPTFKAKVEKEDKTKLDSIEQEKHIQEQDKIVKKDHIVKDKIKHLKVDKKMPFNLEEKEDVKVGKLHPNSKIATPKSKDDKKSTLKAKVVSKKTTNPTKKDDKKSSKLTTKKVTSTKTQKAKK